MAAVRATQASYLTLTALLASGMTSELLTLPAAGLCAAPVQLFTRALSAGVASRTMISFGAYLPLLHCVEWPGTATGLPPLPLCEVVRVRQGAYVTLRARSAAGMVRTL